MYAQVYISHYTNTQLHIKNLVHYHIWFAYWLVIFGAMHSGHPFNMLRMKRTTLGCSHTPPCELDSVFPIFVYQRNCHKYAPVYDPTLKLLFQVSSIYVYRSLTHFTLTMRPNWRELICHITSKWSNENKRTL